MAKVTEEMVAQFMQLRRRGDSFRAIGGKFQVDPRTVKSGIQKAERERDRDHWEAVSRQVDVRHLEEHLGMLVRISIDVQRAVQTSPFQSDREPLGLVAALVAVGLKRTGGLLEGRGLDLRSPVTSGTTDGTGKLPTERLAGKLLNGLKEHEPTLKALLDGWSSYWINVQGERRVLQKQARDLYRQHQIREEVVAAMGPVAAEQAIASALSPDGKGHLTAEEGDDGLATLMLTQGTGRRQVLEVQKAEGETVCQANERVVDQLLLEERIRPLKETYRSLTECAAEIEDQVDDIILRGKPQGDCFLCPKDSRL